MPTPRKKLFAILEIAPRKKGVSWVFDVFLTTLISLNAIVILLESVESINEEYGALFEQFEFFSVIFFTLEYLARLWTCVEYPRFRKPITGRLKYMATGMAIIDLLAILPFYLALMMVDLRFIRILRLFRLFRLFKMTRYLNALNMIQVALRDKRDQLIISMVFVVFMLLIVSSVMYYVEHSAQPEQFSSIPETMWWGVATLTTVGYGDVYPITTLGKFLGGIISILGVGLFALPTGILASGFSEALEKTERKRKSVKCPNCGERFAVYRPDNVEVVDS